MQRARCCAANAYDATSAIQAIFGRSATAHFSKQPTNARHGVGTQGRRAQRSFSTAAQDPRRKELDTTPLEPASRDGIRARKLAFYEELMIETEGRSQDAHFIKQPSIGAQPSTGTQPWRDQMAAMSQYVRDSRERWPEDILHDPKNPEFAKTLDYEGIVIAPEESNVSPPTPIPWAQGYATRQKPYKAAQILDFEIAAFWEHMKATQKEKAVRNRMQRLIWPIIRLKYEPEDVALYSYGSTTTGLAMPYSDIDFAIRDPKDPLNNMEAEMNYLRGALLSRNSEFMCVVHRGPPHAIITAQHIATGIEVQIVAQGRQGYQDKGVLSLLKSFPHLREIYAVVRTALGIRGLVDPYIGGISAYGTFVMVAASLARRGTPSDIFKSPSAQLLHFLSFWAKFDMVKFGMTMSKDAIARPFLKLPPLTSDVALRTRKANIAAARRNGKPQRAGQYRIGFTKPRQPYMLCLQDPTNTYNDLGKNCHAIKHIQATIKAMHRDLVDSMAKYDQGIRRQVVTKDEQSLLLPLVGRSHEMYAERRRRMLVTEPRKYKKSRSNLDNSNQNNASHDNENHDGDKTATAPKHKRRGKKPGILRKTMTFASQQSDKS